MVAEIISVGTEITTGSTLNINTRFLSQQLFLYGIDTYYHTAVDDDGPRLREVFKIAFERSDLIILTGGLGPTVDDLTKETISEELGLDLKIDPQIKKQILQHFKKLNRTMTKNNIKQAKIPTGAVVLKNLHGTAPGILLQIREKIIVMLPGPPKEMNEMFKNEVTPYLKQNNIIISKSINTAGIGESQLETELIKMNLTNNYIDILTYAKDGIVEIKIIARGLNRNLLEDKVKMIANKIKSKFVSYIYGYDNISIEERVVNLLKEKKFRIGICESCTGGLISSKLTSIPGSSHVFELGVITYSNNSKVKELNVNHETINKYGAVSKEAAYEMAKGLIEKNDLDIVASITGIAGPEGGTEEKPVGLIYMCIITRNTHVLKKVQVTGNREVIQNRAAIIVLDEIRKILE